MPPRPWRSWIVRSRQVPRSGDSSAGCPFQLLIGAAELLICVFTRPCWENGAKIETDLLRATYRLTEPGDLVYDEKGETVFRQRAFAPAWESLFAERVLRGLAVDDSAERCIQTHTCVATEGKHISEAAREFIERNYLSVGSSLYVAGKFLQAEPGESRRFPFDVTIPAPYEIVSPGGPVTGSLDQYAYTGARQLMPGKHIFLQTSGRPDYPIALIWAQATDRKFTPFR